MNITVKLPIMASAITFGPLAASTVVTTEATSAEATTSAALMDTILVAWAGAY